jgi:hypothetical protein
MRSSKKNFPHHKMLMHNRFVTLSTLVQNSGPDWTSKLSCKLLHSKGIGTQIWAFPYPPQLTATSPLRVE